MPWDGTELWLAPLDDPGDARLLAGGAAESVFQPEWDAQGRLHFVSDRDGWWNLYRVEGEAVGAAHQRGSRPRPPAVAVRWLDLCLPRRRLHRLHSHRARRGTTGPAGTRRRRGPRDLGLPYTSFGFPSLSSSGAKVAFAAASPQEETAVILLDLAGGEAEIVRAASEESIDPAYSSVPRAITFPTSGDDRRPRLLLPADQPRVRGARRRAAAADRAEPRRPDLAHDPVPRPRVPVLDQPRLRRRRRQLPRQHRLRPRVTAGACRGPGAWSTSTTASPPRATWPTSGEADGARLAIRGGSAGGYATLCALVFHDDFAAGASYYGVADTETLATDTHKFESRYLDGLIGPYPEHRDLYRERSPIHFVEQLRAPVILFQGLDDEVVPPSQSETMVAALKRNGVPHAYLAFAGEAHGFRRAETEIRCLEAELYFYGRILGFEPADELEPVEIDGSAPR